MLTQTRKTNPARLVLAGFLTLATAAGLSACSSSSSNRADEPDATSSKGASSIASSTIETVDRTPEHEAFAKIGYRFEWRGFPFYGSNLNVQFVDLFGDTIIVQDDAATITAMDPISGRNKWSTRLAGDLTRFVGSARFDKTLLCASDTSLYLVDIRTGTIKDKHRLAVVVNTPPVVDGNMAMFGSASGELLGHNLLSGYKQWGYLLNGSITAKPVSVGGGIGAVSQGGDVIIVDPRNGKSRGRALVFEGLTNNPVAGADTLYVASRDQSVYAYEAVSGRRIWRHRTSTPITDQPAVHNGRLYVALPGEGLTAFNGATGEIIWAVQGVKGEPIGIRDGRLFVWDGSTATIIDNNRGDVIESTVIPGLKALKMTSFVDGDLYAVTPAGSVAKYTAID